MEPTSKDLGLHTLSFKLEEALLKETFIYGFKLSEKFKSLLLDVQLQLGTRKTHLKWLAGQTAFKLAATLHPDQVIHFHGGISVAEANQDFWFYCLNPMSAEDMILLEAHINEWLAKEMGVSYFSFNSLPLEEWGAFEKLTLAQLMNKEIFRNGFSVVEKTYLHRLINKESLFLEGAPNLTFHRVISESGSTIISQPYFTKLTTPYSYAIQANINQLPNSSNVILEFNIHIKLWIMEKVFNSFNTYFDKKMTTNAYFYTPESAASDSNSPKVFNQIGLKKDMTKEDEVFVVRSSDRYFCEQMNVDIKSYLEKELTQFSFDEPQLLITLPNAARDHRQTVGKNKKKPNKKITGYGVGLPEKELIFDFIVNQLSQINLTPQACLEKQGGNIPKTDTLVPREELFKTFELEKFLLTPEEEALKIEETDTGSPLTSSVAKEAFIHPDKRSLTIGLFVRDEWLLSGLMGHTRSLLHASEVIDQTHLIYESPSQFKIQFKLFKEPIANELKTTVQSRRVKTTLLELLEQESLDGCFIEIGRLQGKKGDPKSFLRSTFAEMGIPTQFIHNSSFTEGYELKGDVLNRTRAAAKDLLAKLYFAEGSLQAHLKQKDNPILIGVSKIILDNGFHLPCLSKVEEGKTYLKPYPYTNWMDAETIHQTTGRDYVLNVEDSWLKPKEMDREKTEIWLSNQVQLNTDWLRVALNEFHPEKTNQRVAIYWDSRLEDKLFNFNLSQLDNWFDQLLSFELSNGVLLRWVDSVKSPTYLNVAKTKGKNSLGKGKGIYQSAYDERLFYVSGDRPNGAAGTKTDYTKWKNPTAFIIVPGLHQVYLYSKDDKLQSLDEVIFMQKMRKMVVTQDTDACVPYPIYIIRQLNELLDSLFAYHGRFEFHPDHEKEFN